MARMKPEERKHQYSPYRGTASIGETVSFRYNGKSRFGKIVELGGSVGGPSAWIKLKMIDGSYRTFSVCKIEL